MPETIGLLLLLSGAALWWSNLEAREAANQAMRATCRSEGLLFLDDTVAFASVRPVRDSEGRMRIRWIYDFAFSDTGHNRRHGRVEVVGGAVTSVELDLAPAPPGSSLH